MGADVCEVGMIVVAPLDAHSQHHPGSTLCYAQRMSAPQRRYGWPPAQSELIPVGSEVECLRQGKVACFGVVVEHCTSAEFLNRPGALGRMGYVVQTEAWTVLGLARDKSWWAPDSVRPV